MTKVEFLQQLKDHLSGEVSPEALMDSYRYYDSYIDEVIRSGKTEEEAVEELGKPYLIARSIIDASTGARAVDVEYTEDGKTKKVNRKAEEQKQQKQQKQQNDGKAVKERKSKRFVFNPFSWYAMILYLLLIVLLVVIVIAVLGGLIWLAVTFAIPILLILGVVYLIAYFTQK